MSEIKWKKYKTMSPGDWHPHRGEWTPEQEAHNLQGTLRCEKGHYVNRPYLKYSTSKWEQGMIDVYEVLFNHWKEQPITLLEFGVYYGESMHYYRDFFTNPDARIVGFDHQPTEFYGKEHRGGLESYVWPGRHNVHLVKGEQRSDADVKKVCEDYGPFDIINDDGMHDYPHPTEDVFRICWPYVKEGGYYLIEDVDSKKTKHLLDEIVVKGEGKGFSLHGGFQGFGTHGGGGAILVLMKTKNRITGLDEVLTED